MNKNIYEALLSLKEKADAGKLENGKAGICSNLLRALKHENPPRESGVSIDDIVFDFMEEAVQTWDDFSGNYSYPVPSPDDTCEDAPYKTYDNAYEAGTMWQGAYGELRKSLLNHLIEYAKEQITLKGTPK